MGEQVFSSADDPNALSARLADYEYRGRGRQLLVLRIGALPCYGAAKVVPRLPPSSPPSQAGQQIVTKQLNVQPTIQVRPGWPLRVIVYEDLVMRAWADQ